MPRTQPHTFMDSRFFPRESFRPLVEHISFILAEKHYVPIVYHQDYLNQTVGSTNNDEFHPSS